LKKKSLWQGVDARPMGERPMTRGLNFSILCCPPNSASVRVNFSLRKKKHTKKKMEEGPKITMVVTKDELLNEKSL
jgi:hypothetical protein